MSLPRHCSGSRPPIRSCASTTSTRSFTGATRRCTGKVGLISGGGSGHEPLHGGFVGLGMLDAACAGEVFTSPVPDQMLEATRTVDGGAGVLHIVKNYTGDVMNFEMAAELAAADTGVEVDLGRHRRRRRRAGQPLHRRPPRRGRHRAGGEDRGRGGRGGPQPGRGGRGRPRASTSNGRSMGMALTSCTVPAAGQPTFDLPDDEMEIGIGIHGEPGRRRVPLRPRPRRSPSCWSSRSSPTSTSRAATACSPSSTAWAARR